MTTRTEAETKILREHAEKLVRENWKRTDISRLLGVPLHTLARWAFLGGWRAKDIAAEGEAERLAALNERLAARQKALCGRSAEQLEYKSADPPGEYSESYSGSYQDLPKFLTRGGPEDEQVRWAAPELRVKTPPWAPGNNFEDPEAASLWLAEDLMRQGLLVEAERALRWTKNWLVISRQVFDKQDAEDARRAEYEQRQEEERAREKARRKALGLPDPNDEANAFVAEWKRKQNSNNNSVTTIATSPPAGGAGREDGPEEGPEVG